MLIEVDGCRLHASVNGRERGPVLMLSNALGATEEMWSPQLAALGREFRIVRYDTRGHGKSALSDRPYDLTDLGRDAIAIMDELGLRQVHWCGLSLGGMVGQWVAVHAPERIDRLILSNTTALPNHAAMRERARAVDNSGLPTIIEGLMENWFSEDFRSMYPKAIGWVRDMVLACPPAGYAQCCNAIATIDTRALLAKIAAPTLVIAGRYDRSAPLDAANAIRQHIPHANMTIIDAAHLANVEQPHAYTDMVIGHLTQR